MYETLLFLHVLAAFLYVAAYVWFTVVILAGRRTDRTSAAIALFRTVRPANVVAAIGGIGTLVLGVWLAIYVDGYELWDPWILAALILWALSVELGRREGQAYIRGGKYAQELAASNTETSAELNTLLRTTSGLVYHIAGSVLVLAILWLMIYKPGA